MSRSGGVLVAAGRSTRMGFDKVWAPLRGKPVVVYGLEALAESGLHALVLVVPEDRYEAAETLVAELAVPFQVRVGGARRRDSVLNGLTALAGCDWVVIHDAARPLASAELVRRGLEAARPTGVAVPGVPLSDTVKRVQGDRVVETVPREELRRIQTPQVFSRDLLARALAATDEDVSDEAVLLERIGAEVRVFPGDAANLKLTEPQDLRLADFLLQARERGAHRHA